MLYSQEKLTPEQKQMARRRRILQGRAAQGICILAAFAAISLFAAGWLLLRQDRTFSDSENRMLAQKPAPTLASLADGSFAEGLERWYADQFPGRDLCITADLTFQRMLGVREMNGVYLGADGYLLEAPAQEDAAQLGQTEAAICAFAAQHPDIRLTAAIVPNAWGVLSEKLPAGAPVEDQKALIDAIDQAMPDVRTANLTEALRCAARSRSITAPTTTGRAWPPATPLRRFPRSWICSRCGAIRSIPSRIRSRGRWPQRPAATRRSIPSRSTSRTRTCSTP